MPTFRKRWVFALCVLFFIPAGIAIALSGDVYANQNGQIVKYTDGARIGLAIAWAVIITVNLVRTLS